MPRPALLLALFLTPAVFAPRATAQSVGTQSVTFARRAAAVGDSVTQAMTVSMSLKQTGRQGTQIVEETERRSDRRQTRHVVVTQVRDGRVAAAQATFLESLTETGRGSEADPIRGKTYACRRDGENLVITTPDGQTPPLAEYELVARAMATLGKPSPLARFLAGRTVAVGERLELPAEVARRALGFDESLGEVDRFTLTLKRVESGTAVFDAAVEATGVDGQQMRMAIGGDFGIEAAACRVVSADLSGPIAMSAHVGGYTIDARGKMRFSIASRYE